MLEQVKSNKAKGHDSIPPRALKASAPTIAQPLSDLIRAHKHNYCKVGSTTNLETRRHKKDSLLEKTNYRPITVLPAFSKVFERILHIQMSKHFESTLHKYMFAYRKFHGCPAALLTLTEQWKAELDKHNVIGTAVIDLSKAFDCLPHQLILEKLKLYGMDNKLVVLMDNYLSSRFQRVKLRGTYSTWQEVSRGVPQGSILGPLLFLKYFHQ